MTSADPLLRDTSVGAPAIFDPITIRGREFRNRIWVSPMCQYAVEELDGVPRDWHLVHLGSFARGGAGLVMAEATAVAPEGRIAAQDVGIWNDEQADAWTRLVEFIHSQGSLAGIQLSHAGRKASTYREWSGTGSQAIEDGGWETVAPSAIAYAGLADPRALTTEEIDQLIETFVSAAERAVRAGFDVIEIHAAHGYLLNQFLSSVTNTRPDEHGGSLENRARLLLEIVRRVRAVIGEDLPLFVRFSATDWREETEAVDEIAEVVTWAAEAGADWFDISTGGLVPDVKIPVRPLYQVEYATGVKERAGVRVNAVGLITSAEEAEQVVASGAADAVMIGREFLRDPHFALRAAHELGVEIDYWQPNYRRGKWRRRSN